MKVLHIAYYHGKNDSRIVQKECISLMKEGYEVFYATADCNEIETVPKGIQYIPIKSRNKSLLVNYCINKDLKREYCKIIEQIEPEIVHIHEYGISYLVRLVKKQYKNIKVVYDVHEDNAYMNYEDDIERYGKCIAKILAFLRSYKEKQACKFADIVVVATPHIKELLEKVSHRIITIRNYPVISPVDISHNKKNQVCYVGGITAARGITDLVAISGRLKGDLRLAGPVNEDYIKLLLDRFQEGYRKNWFYEGVLSREKVNVLYAESKVGICTLKNIQNHYYALPIKLFEYMAAGLPVVVSSFPLWKEIIEDAKCGFCVCEDDSEEIIGRINYLLLHPSEAEKMGENGHRAVLEKYCWRIEEKKLLQVYADLL